MNKLIIDDTVYNTEFTKKYKLRKAHLSKDPKQVRAFIPGTIKEIFVKKGQKVKRGDSLLILEAMKMMNEVRSMTDGKVKNIKVGSEERIVKDQLLLELE